MSFEARPVLDAWRGNSGGIDRGDVLRKAVQHRIGATTLAAVVLLAATSCAGRSAAPSGSANLDSLKSSHVMDERAKNVCAKDIGTPISSSTSRVKLLVAADSTLSIVRRVEAPGYAQSQGDAVLEGSEQGYAARSLVSGISCGSPIEGWSFDLPDGDSGFINPG